MKPIVSVIIPAYNAGKWIQRSIESVLNQSMDNWELIVVDDGSSDNTLDILRSYRDKRITTLSQDNAGPSAARNRGIEMARGDYIALLDADDEYAPTFLDRTTSFLNRYHECIGCTTNVVRVKRNGDKYVYYGDTEIISGDEGVVRDLLAIRIKHRSFPMLYLVLRASLIPELGPFAPENIAGAEEELLLRWLPKGPFSYINEPLVYYYDTPGSLIKDIKRSSWSKRVVWEKVIPRDKELCRCLPSYRQFRDLRMFRAALTCVASGCFEDAKHISHLWPMSPCSLHWWVGFGVSSLPKPIMWMLHKCVAWSRFVKYRNHERNIR